MDSKIDALTNDRSDRQFTMMQMWQDRMEQNQQKLQKPQGVQNDSDAELMRKIKNGEIECPTCKERQYVDGSDDAGVSFKTPRSVSPGQSKAAVLSHEQEHVTRNRAAALSEGREVTHSSVSIHYATCPTCGKQYVAGGLTRTETQAVPDKAAQQQENAFKGLLNMKI